jgi:hypothetical protein
MDGRRSNLMDTAQLASWPTPRAADGAKGGKRRVATGQDLPTTASEVIRAASWATPSAQEAGGTPEAFLQAQLVGSGPVPTGCSAGIPQADRPSPGQLNPSLSRWLMGYPMTWEIVPQKER